MNIEPIITRHIIKTQKGHLLNLRPVTFLVLEVLSSMDVGEKIPKCKMCTKILCCINYLVEGYGHTFY